MMWTEGMYTRSRNRSMFSPRLWFKTVLHGSTFQQPPRPRARVVFRVGSFGLPLVQCEGLAFGPGC